MPKIPQYNQGLGPSVELAAAQLSPRANVGAFTAPSQALAGVGQQVGDIAFKFGMAEKKAETERVYAEELSSASTDFDEFKRTQPARTVEGFNITAGEFKNNRIATIDSRTDLTTSQKNSIKQSLGKNLDIKISSARSQVFAQHQADRKVAFTDSINSLISDASDVSMREQTLADIDYLINFSIENGFDTGQRIDAVKYELEKKDHLAERQNPNLGVDYFQGQLELVESGKGKYSDYTSARQRETANLIRSHISYLETGVKAQAEQDRKTAINNIALTGSAGQAGQDAANAFRMLGDETAAEELETQILVSEDVWAATRSIAFDSSEDITAFMSMQRDMAEELAKDGRSTEAMMRLEALNKFVIDRQKAITEDPLGYITSTYKQLYDREPTRAQLVQAQEDMGFEDEDIKVLTQEEVKDFVRDIGQANTAEEVATLVRGVTGDAGLTPYVMRQLRANGMNLATSYIANQPGSTSSQLLLEASRPGAITISVSPTARDRVFTAVKSNPTVVSHLKSMAGGTYFDFSNNEIVTAASGTTAQANARDEHVKMLEDLTIYLMQKDGLVLSGGDGISATDSQINDYAEKAATLLNDRYDYIESFPNASVSLRVPASMAVYKNSITAGLNGVVEELGADEIFYQDPTYEEGTPEYIMSKEKYVERVKSEFGWIAENDGGKAYLVDATGGLVFNKDGEPISMTLTDAFSKTQAGIKAQKMATATNKEKREAAQGLRREARNLTGGELSRIRREEGDAAAEAAIAERDRLNSEADALIESLE